MALSQGWVKRYFKAFCKGFFVAVPVAVTFLDQVACVARVEGASMQPSLNPGGSQSSDVVLLNHWKVRNFEVQRGDIVSLVPLTAVASPAAEHRLRTHRLSGHGPWAQPLRGTWDPPGPGHEPAPPPHRQADPQPLHHQGSPLSPFFLTSCL
ncbi:mitochondrial inner membrane protease subunit 2 isoform X6 [Physeter macrocephalus]|uniref:Mitochondrial inner membrane protease subunit 2 isoform X6 n=1 Tax=Physeter macrocephalus TaxID=9755 RepID=A0A9W2WNL5_PHYMC|nr:mitochondrial inner membrane protease subunit 2 isoform X6 [Physeter catodon]